MQTLRLEARWDKDGRVWIATCNGLPDLDIRAATMSELIAATTSLFESALRRHGCESDDVHFEVRCQNNPMPNGQLH